MIKAVEIKNFQSHKNTRIDFCQNINSIVGQSNSGKTAILRALHWVIYNTPGDAFVSHWARDEKGNQKEDTSVTIYTDNHIISRVKGKSKNLYIVDGKTLEAVGVNVPDEVVAALNISDVNVQKQMDAPFLLADSAGAVARFFNSIVGLNDIDVYLTSVESKKRKLRSELEITKSNLDQTKKELNKYSWVNKASKLLEKIREYESQLEKQEQEADKLRTTLIEYKELQEKLQKFKIIETANIYIASIKEKLLAIRTIKAEYDNLAKQYTAYNIQKRIVTETNFISEAMRLVRKIQTVREELEEQKRSKQKILDSYTTYVAQKEKLASYVILDKAEKYIIKLNSLQTKLNGFVAQKNKIKDTIQTYEYNKQEVGRIDAEFQETQALLPDRCPLCGSPLPHDHNSKE